MNTKVTTFAERLKQLLDIKQIKQADLCHLTGIHKSRMSRYVNGGYEAKQDSVYAIAQAMNVNEAWLMGFDVPMERNSSSHNSTSLPDGIMPLPKTVKKPRLGTIACGKPVLAVEEAEQWDAVPEGIDCDFTLECKGDSMINARIFPGDIVYIKAQPIVENGEIAAVLIGEETTLKKVYYNNSSDRIVLQPCNPLYSDMVYSGSELDEIKILGKAVAFLSKVRV